MECYKCSNIGKPEYDVQIHKNLAVVDCRCTECYQLITSVVMGMGDCFPEDHSQVPHTCVECSTVYCEECSHDHNCPVCGCPPQETLIEPVPDVDMERPWMPLEFRVTHKYHAGYKWDDTWVDVGYYRIMGKVPIKIDGDSEEQLIICQTHSKASIDVIKEAFEESFSKGCTCEHDCCGCEHGSPSNVEQIGDTNVFIIHRTLFRNV